MFLQAQSSPRTFQYGAIQKYFENFRLEVEIFQKKCKITSATAVVQCYLQSFILRCSHIYFTGDLQEEEAVENSAAFIYNR